MVEQEPDFSLRGRAWACLVRAENASDLTVQAGALSGPAGFGVWGG